MMVILRIVVQLINVLTTVPLVLIVVTIHQQHVPRLLVRVDIIIVRVKKVMKDLIIISTAARQCQDHVTQKQIRATGQHQIVLIH